MKYVMAVSGGVDSVVLLDLAAQLGFDKKDIVVAHFDHGIRKESSADARFVQKLAEKRKLPFALGEGKLGHEASEATARKARYEFLRSITIGSDPVKIVTAHHQDDLIETIIMNIMRGTEWRGLTPFWSSDILRPLIHKTKAEIVDYALSHNLQWMDDKTNYDSRYFRNRVRALLAAIRPNDRKAVLKLNQKQTLIRAEIENILRPKIASTADGLKQSAIKKLPEKVALEILKFWTNFRLTTPQSKKLLSFIKSAKSGDVCHPGGGLQIALYCDNMTLNTLKK